MSANRASDPGWVRIGRWCDSKRRSLWMRMTPKPEALICKDHPDPDMQDAYLASPENVEKIELCAGREGDDDYVVIEPSNPQWAELVCIFNSARYAVDLAEEFGEKTSPHRNER